jgi:N-methylhydantoinase A
LPLDKDLSYRAIEENIARPLNISVEKAAHGMFTIVNNNMVNGIRRVSVERGYDPRDFVLVAAGGATGAHITALANEMGIDTIVASKLTSGLCAYGQIISDVKYNYMATIPVRLEGNETFSRINSMFKDIEAKGTEHLNSDGFANKDIDIQRSMEMRYVGQIHECTVDIGSFEITADTIEKVKNSFHDRHEQLFTYSERHNPVELVNIESTMYGRVERPNPSELGGNNRIEDAIKSHRDLIFSDDGKSTSVPVYDGAKISAGNRFSGPAVIEEETATIVIQPGWQVELHKSASYVITRVR